MKNIFIPFIAGLLGILVGAITVYNIISSDYQSIEVVTKPTATPNQKEVVKANDTRCDLPGVCSQLCIGEDCRNEWPKAGDTRCDEPGKCSQVCIGEDCRYV